jgi:hypothetical protein
MTGLSRHLFAFLRLPVRKRSEGGRFRLRLVRLTDLKFCRMCVPLPSVLFTAEELLRKPYRDLLEIACVTLNDCKRKNR